jgi:hypothetical protein
MLFLYSEFQVSSYLNEFSSVRAAGLNTAAKAIGLEYFGSATDNPELNDAPYVEKLSDTEDFGQTTPGNSQKVCPDVTFISRNILAWVVRIFLTS